MVELGRASVADFSFVVVIMRRIRGILKGVKGHLFVCFSFVLMNEYNK